MKKILVPLTGRPLDARAVPAAFAVARHFGGSVQGLGVAPQVEVRSSIESAAIPAALMEQLVRIGQADQAEVIRSARQLFDETAARSPGIAASWSQATGPLAETISEEARLADLTVIAQPTDGTNAMGPAIEAALFGCGRPILLPPLAEPASIGTAMAVAWDGGSAAARAVAAALPFFRTAGRVVVLSAGVTAESSRVADPARLVEYLSLHGIAATVRPVEVAGRAVSTALTDAAGEESCDLLVMGAYGHSRMRELVLGGVTQDVLRKPPALAILMAH